MPGDSSQPPVSRNTMGRCSLSGRAAQIQFGSSFKRALGLGGSSSQMRRKMSG